MTSVAITGVSGRSGQRVLRLLDAERSVDRIVGIDRVEPAFRPRGLEFHALDVSAADLKAVLEGVDVVVHLAAVLDPLPDEDVMERVNVEGTRRVLEAAAAVAASKVVLVSTAYAYGAHTGNPSPMTEDHPLRPNQSYAFAVHKAECERLLADWADDHPAATTTVLRPPFVVGGGTPPSVRALVRGRLPVRVRDATPSMQYLHVDDLASAVALAVTDDLPGAYNVAPEGSLPFEEAAALGGWAPRISVSADVAERLLGRLWHAGIGDIVPGALPLLVHPCVVASDRLRARGWAPAHTNGEAVLAVLEEEGGSAPDRSRALMAAAGAGAALTAAAAAWAVLRRRR